MGEPETRPRRSKAARNERRKLLATACNNLGVALLLAAFVQPTALYLQQRRIVDFEVALASTIYFLVAVAMLIVAQRVAERLED